MLENQKVNIKIKISALWTAVMFCYVYGDYFQLYAPNKVDDLLNGTNNLDSPTKLLMASILMAIPSLMIALSVLLKPKISRLLNIIFGILFTLLMLLIAFTSLTAWYSFYVFLALLESIITAVIVYYAWTWPKNTTD